MPMMMKSKSMPPEMVEAAEEADVAFEDVVPRPEKPYNPRTVTSLAKALTDLAIKMFGMKDMKSESYSGPVESIDPRMSQILMMVAEAARDYGAPLPVEPSQIKSDADLVAITAHLVGLLSDRDFKDFLASPDEAEDEGESDGDEDTGSGSEPFNFASRMARGSGR